MLDRDSLSTIATAGGGRYFELDREPDRAIANAAAGFLLLGVLFVNDRAALALHLGAAAATLALLTTVFT